MKQFSGKAIYNPSGAAGEYSYWACNLYVGCSAKCEYCYCKSLLRGQWSDTPHLKKTLKDYSTAFHIFNKELLQNKEELQKSGLFFNFVSDPCLPETRELNWECIELCILNHVPVKILTKQSQWINDFDFDRFARCEKEIAIGFTLTGHDELESGADSNSSRIEAMRVLHRIGFITWASIEPIIDFPSAKNMINQTLRFCDLYKVGLMSGKKYDIVEAQSFVEWLNELEQPKIYLKESMQKLTRYTNKELDSYFVDRDYNIFTEK